MSNTDSTKNSSNEKAVNEIIRRVLVWGAKLIGAAIITGLGTFFFGVYNDIKDLQAKDNIHDTKIAHVEKETSVLVKQVDQLHWHLIRKPKVELPAEVK